MSLPDEEVPDRPERVPEKCACFVTEQQVSSTSAVWYAVLHEDISFIQDVSEDAQCQVEVPCGYF